MPLSPPVGRQLLHTRRVTCQGFFREDGLWDIEGHITDEKSYEHANEWRGTLGPGDFVHADAGTDHGELWTDEGAQVILVVPPEEHLPPEMLA